MLCLSKTLVALKQPVFHGVVRHDHAKLPTVEVHVVDGKKHMSSAPCLKLGPMVWSCHLTHSRPVDSKAPSGSALISESSDLLCSSSTTSSATSYRISEDRPSTVRVLTIQPHFISNTLVPDSDGEKARCGLDIEWEYMDMFLNKTAKVDQQSGRDADAPVGMAPPGTFPALKRKKRVVPRRITELSSCALCIGLFRSTNTCS
jgi:hypothetical protein